MDRQRVFTLILLAVVGTGCRHEATPEFPDWVGQLSSREVATDDSGNAFKGYERAAREAEKSGGRYLDMVSFYPGQRHTAILQTEAALSTLEQACADKCEFDFVPSNPFKAPPDQLGWRLLGRDLVWKIGEAIEQGKLDDAVKYANIATKFGFDISGGAAVDASLGLAIANEARQAIAPALDRLDAAQLGTLATGITNALNGKPTIKSILDHEHEDMLECVQLVQDAYQKEDFDGLARDLGPDSRSAIDFLKELKRKDLTKRPLYFTGFAAEANAEAKWMDDVADLSVAKRSLIPEPKFTGERPWKKFAKEFFSSAQPLLQMNDTTLARTRLLILEASILQQVKASGSAPKDLSQFPDELRTDPFSGKPFVYGADGADFHVYSVGADLRDDGGDTDETYTQPDLKLEREG